MTMISCAQNFEDVMLWEPLLVELDSLEAALLASSEQLSTRPVELARLRKALTEAHVWANSLQTDFLLKNEALAVQRAEIAALTNALSANDGRLKALDSAFLERNTAFEAFSTSTSCA
jgi:hypothetical protein